LEQENLEKIMSLTVLTIDDDPSMTDLLSILLKNHGLDVLVANSGVDGIALAQKHNPNIIILDLMMPGMDGWQVCRKIREFSNMPIIILSALDNPGMVASALDAGADDYLIKPVPSGVLIAHLNNLTRRANAEQNGIAMNIHNNPFIAKPIQA
jgi:DNA-binding response OmpR family regulator